MTSPYKSAKAPKTSAVDHIHAAWSSQEENPGESEIVGMTMDE